MLRLKRETDKALLANDVLRQQQHFVVLKPTIVAVLAQGEQDTVYPLPQRIVQQKPIAAVALAAGKGRQWWATMRLAKAACHGSRGDISEPLVERPGDWPGRSASAPQPRNRT